MARALESSPSAVEMLHRKAEQMGIGVANSQAHQKHVLELQVSYRAIYQVELNSLYYKICY